LQKELEFQRFKNIMTNSSDSEDEPSIDMISTFKNFISKKNFGEPDKHLTFKDYYKLNFINDVPEIVCDILCYLSKYYHYRTNAMERALYERLMDAQQADIVLETDQQRENKNRFAWRYTIEGLNN